MKSSGNMYESSDTQFFRITTGISSGTYAFDERFNMTFLPSWELQKYYGFRLLIGEKTGKEILKSLRLEFLKKF